MPATALTTAGTLTIRAASAPYTAHFTVKLCSRSGRSALSTPSSALSVNASRKGLRLARSIGRVTQRMPCRAKREPNSPGGDSITTSSPRAMSCSAVASRKLYRYQSVLAKNTNFIVHFPAAPAPGWTLRGPQPANASEDEVFAARKQDEALQPGQAGDRRGCAARDPSRPRHRPKKNPAVSAGHGIHRWHIAVSGAAYSRRDARAGRVYLS